MAELQSKGIASLDPNDFIEGGSTPKRVRGKVTRCCYLPRPIKRGGEKHAFFALVRLDDELTDKTYDFYYRAGWLPSEFDGRLVGSVPTNDGADVSDDDREPTAPLEFFVGLGAGTQKIPADVDPVEEYGGYYAMGSFPQKEDAWHHFLGALTQCGFVPKSYSLEAIEGLTLTLELTKTGTYTDKEGRTKDQNIHLPVEMEDTKKSSGKKKSTKATEKAKAKPQPEEDDDEEEEKPKASSKSSGKKSAAKPEPEDEEDEDQEDEESTEDEDEDDEATDGASVLHGLIVKLLRATPEGSVPDGEVLIRVYKDKTFTALPKKEQKAAIEAYNDRSLFKESDTLFYSEKSDVVRFRKGKS